MLRREAVPLAVSELHESETVTDYASMSSRTTTKGVDPCYRAERAREIEQPTDVHMKPIVRFDN